MKKKLRDRYLIISAIQMLALPAIVLLEQSAGTRASLAARVAQTNTTIQTTWPIERMLTSSVIFFVLVTWAILHFQNKNKRYQDGTDRIYPVLPAESALAMLGYTAFVSYLGTDTIQTYYYAVGILVVTMLIEVAKVSYYLVNCPNETIHPALRNKKQKAAPNKHQRTARGNEFVKRKRK